VYDEEFEMALAESDGDMEYAAYAYIKEYD
jgi:hypothetical protein